MLILLLVCQQAWALVPYGLELGHYRALIIANQNYQQMTPLRTPHRDAEALATLLRSDYGFKVTTLKDVDRKTTLDELDSLVEKLTPRDNLLIFYAGHGHLDKATGEGYWLPVTANPRRRSEWISNSDITDTLRATRASHVMVISDSCFSGTLTRNVRAGLNVGQDRSAYYHKLVKKRSRTALTSGGIEPVADGGANGHSVFAGALLAALRNNNEPVIEGEQVYQQLRRPVALNSTAQQKPTYSDVRATGHDGGDFVFHRKDAVLRGTATAPSQAPAPPASGVTSAAGREAAYELAFWNSIENSQDASDYQAYLDTYPDGQFAVLARVRLRKLQASRPEPEVRQAEQPPVQLAIARPQATPAAKVAASPARANTVLVVRAVPDSEYSPEFSSIEAYSTAIAEEVKSFYPGTAMNVVTNRRQSRSLVFESGSHEQSRALCQQYSAKRVMSIELDLTRDIEEFARTPDVIYYNFFDCKTARKTLKEYSVDFEADEKFTYHAALLNTLGQYDKAFNPLGK